MVGSVREVYSSLLPSYNMGQLRLLLQSPCINQVFILVEGQWDRTLYRKLLGGNKVNIGMADENGHGGYHYVESIVKEISDCFPKARVIGIRDRDYTRFEKGRINHPSVFMTDEHSLEMMLLSSEGVCKSLALRLTSFDVQYPVIIRDARHVASYYIYSTIENLNVEFEAEKMRLHFFVDTNGQMKDNWKEELRARFFDNPKCKGHTPAQKNRKVCFINSMSDCTVCRGHDVLNTCYNRLSHGSLTLDDIMQIMVDAYSMTDFRQTRLYNKLLVWQKQKKVSLLP